MNYRYYQRQAVQLSVNTVTRNLHVSIPVLNRCSGHISQMVLKNTPRTLIQLWHLGGFKILSFDVPIK
jgi:hypothetical protein